MNAIPWTRLSVATVCRQAPARPTVSRWASVILAGTLACAPAPEGFDGPFFLPTTPHETYESRIRGLGLEATALGWEWITAGRRALGSALPVRPPYEEVGYLDPLTPGAMGYRLRLDRGQIVRVEIQWQDATDTSRVFVDLYRATEDTLRPHRHEAAADSGNTALEFFVRRGGDYIVRVQPELLRGGRYTILIESGASLAFPVDRRGMEAIRSRWGDPRDGGRRRHEGVDIFAPRGTPVLAAADGRVRSTRIGGLGGKVVWLRDRFGQSHYYAHLDSQTVRRGQPVRRGDTIGFVGNTGNARTTPPHLHFGLYSRGAYDPWPALETVEGGPAPITADATRVGGWSRTRIADQQVRATPSPRGAVVAQIPRHTPLRVVGGVGPWYRVILPDGAMGFVRAQGVEPADRAIRQAAVVDGGWVRERPSAGAPVKDRIRPGGEVAVLGSFGEFLYVRAEEGPVGWLESGE